MSCTKNHHYWTAEEKAKVAELMKGGLSGARIGAIFGVTRNAVIGLVARDATLKAIGLRGQRFGGLSGTRKPPTDEQTKEKRRKKSKAYYWRKKGEEPPAGDGRKSRKTARIIAPREKPKLRLVGSVDEWLAQNGGPRRFERGFSTDYYSIRQYLADRGVRFENHRNQPKLYQNGRAKSVTWPEVHALVDEFRIAEGLTPIIQRAA